MELDLATTTNAPRRGEAPERIEAISPGCAMARPKIADEGIVLEAAERIAEECATWGKGQANEWIPHLVKITRDEWLDGYKLARALEDRAMIDPDSELVEILDGAYSTLADVHEKATRQWVRIVGFDPAFRVGDEVSCPHGDGVVHSVRVETAQYIVDTDGRGTGGIIMDAERVTVRASA